MATTLDRDDIIAGLREIIAELRADSEVAGIRLVGGAALSLRYFDRGSTQDLNVPLRINQDPRRRSSSASESSPAERPQTHGPANIFPLAGRDRTGPVTSRIIPRFTCEFVAPILKGSKMTSGRCAHWPEGLARTGRVPETMVRDPRGELTS